MSEMHFHRERQAGLSAQQTEDFHLDKKLRNLKSKEKINVCMIITIEQ